MRILNGFRFGKIISASYQFTTLYMAIIMAFLPPGVYCLQSHVWSKSITVILRLARFVLRMFKQMQHHLTE